MSGAAIVSRELVYHQFYRLWRLAVRMPDGAVVERHMEDHGPAAAVLPYDPVRRCALLVTMPRAPVMDAGEPDMLEAVAGLIDDEPTATARREAMEEAGVRLDALQPVGEIWLMPALSKERLSLFLAPYNAADRIADGGGAAGEHENVTVHEIALADLRRMRLTGALRDGKTLMLVQALELGEPQLFEGDASAPIPVE